MIIDYKGYQIRDPIRTGTRNGEAPARTRCMFVVRITEDLEEVIRRVDYKLEEGCRNEAIDKAKRYIDDLSHVGKLAQLLGSDQRLRDMGITEGSEGLIIDVRRAQRRRVQALTFLVRFHDQEVWLRDDEVLVRLPEPGAGLDIKASVWMDKLPDQELPTDWPLLVAYGEFNRTAAVVYNAQAKGWTFWYSGEDASALVKEVHHYMDTVLSPTFFNPEP